MSRSVAPGPAPRPNRLLAALSARDHERLRPHLEPVALPFRAVLYEPNQPLSFVYFPDGGVVSLLIPPEGRGEGVEVGMVGREGVVGLSVFLGADSTPARWLVQVPGTALRMAAETFRAHVARGIAYLAGDPEVRDATSLARLALAAG